MRQFTFKISDVAVSVRADDPAVFAALKAFFSGYTVQNSAVTKHRITISASTNKKPPVVPGKNDPMLFSYGRINGYRLKNGILLLSDKRTTVLVDSSHDRADAYVDLPVLKRGTEFVSIFITIALIELLRHRGLYYLHASAVKKGNNSILLCGMGMSGKTTLSLGLVFKGYRLCSDDAVFLKHDGKAIRAVGFRKDVHVTGKTLLQYAHELRGTKPPVPPFRKATVPYSWFKTVRSVIPRAIFFLQLAKRQDTEIVPLESTRAMSLLIPQSLMMFFHKGTADKHIGTLNALIRQTKAYLCLCGRDLLKDPLIIFKRISNE